MPQLAANKLVDEVIKRGLHPALKAGGYKKKGRTFYHESDAVIRVVNVQSSRGNTADSSKFTINLGLYFPSVREVSPERPLDDVPKEYDCTIRQRIGLLMPRHDDHWWVVTPSSNVHDVADEIGEAWKTYGETWIERCGDLHVARDEAERMGDTLTAAVMSVALSDKGRAKKLFKGTFERSSPLAHRYLQSWAKRHNLID